MVLKKDGKKIRKEKTKTKNMILWITDKLSRRGNRQTEKRREGERRLEEEKGAA